MPQNAGMSEIVRYTYVDSPLGKLLITACNAGIRSLSFPREQGPRRADEEWEEVGPVEIPGVEEQLNAYFAGELTEFDLPLNPIGTEFQQSVWKALQTIPYGETISYGEQARRIGNPNASRAVGGANGANPIAIVIPCHRVIGSNKSLTGFTGGLDKKQFLLAHEQAVKPPEEDQLRLI